MVSSWHGPELSARSLKERLPLLEFPAATQDYLRRHGPPRPKRTACEPHVGLVRRLPALAKIAGPASRDEILPRVIAASRPREDMVDVQLPQRRTLAAVLTLVRVAEHK